MFKIKFQRIVFTFTLSALLSILMISMLLTAQPIKTTCTFDLCQPERIRIFSSILNDSKWPENSRIKVLFLENPRGSSLNSDQIRNIITDATREWSTHCGITFEFVNELPADVRITFRDGFGNNALLGTNNINWSRDFDTNVFEPGNTTGSNVNFDFPNNYTEREVRATVLHEFGHVLGLIHEHTRPDNGIPWDEAAVISSYSFRLGWDEARIRRNILTAYNETDVSNCGEPDRLSIMHYSVPNELTIGDFEVEQNLNLSPQDKNCINEYYPKPSSVTILPPILDPSALFRKISIVSKKNNPKLAKSFKEITISYTINNSCIVEYFKIDGKSSFNTSLSIPKNADNIEVVGKLSQNMTLMPKVLRNSCRKDFIRMPIAKENINKSVKIVIQNSCIEFQ